MTTQIKRDTKQAHQYTWAQYLSLCKRLCPKHISFDVLTMLVPFYQAYTNNVPHRRLMSEIEHVESLNWLTPDQRIKRINDVVNN